MTFVPYCIFWVKSGMKNVFSVAKICPLPYEPLKKFGLRVFVRTKDTNLVICWLWIIDRTLGDRDTRNIIEDSCPSSTLNGKKRNPHRRNTCTCWCQVYLPYVSVTSLHWHRQYFTLYAYIRLHQLYEKPSTDHPPSPTLMKSSAALWSGLLFWLMDKRKHFAGDFAAMLSSLWSVRTTSTAYHTHSGLAPSQTFIMRWKMFSVLLKALHKEKTRENIFVEQEGPQFSRSSKSVSNSYPLFYSKGTDATRHSSLELSQWMECLVRVRNSLEWIDLSMLSKDVDAVVFHVRWLARKKKMRTKLFPATILTVWERVLSRFDQFWGELTQISQNFLIECNNLSSKDGNEVISSPLPSTGDNSWICCSAS